MEYFEIDQIIKKYTFNSKFSESISREALLQLCKKGILNTQRKLIADDEILKEYIHYGIQNFVYGQQGWCFFAVKADINDVTNELQKQDFVEEFVLDVKPLKMCENVTMNATNNKRHVFVAKIKHTSWCIVIQSVHWFSMIDAEIGIALAKNLSGILKTKAICAWDDDFSDSVAILFENGEKCSTISKDFYSFFYEQKITIPSCFIGAVPENKDKMHLYVEAPSAIEKLNYFIFIVEKVVSGVGYKLGAMEFAAQMSDQDEDFTDEEFSEAMVDLLLNADKNKKQ